ncbi:FxSxx-COOH cyclophane-containing RiPP peptide [Streptomyces lushanensis]|uniref:FxSxx-COOH cyclophane-containing RiPP peptide n=1 Tax=Streptomyces lushanensis TaxID=1434255 RepID=UPI00099F552A|nr:FxSxx-COOH cyclophane-containing RiPP peptide [Streptomyces lushanensis]
MSDVTCAAVDGTPGDRAPDHGAPTDGAPGYEGLADEDLDDRASKDRAPGGGTAAGGGELPDLLALDLETLRTLDHPVLAEVVADLRGRAEQPRELLWGFNNAF